MGAGTQAPIPCHYLLRNILLSILFLISRLKALQLALLQILTMLMSDHFDGAWNEDCNDVR